MEPWRDPLQQVTTMSCYKWVPRIPRTTPHRFQPARPTTQMKWGWLLLANHMVSQTIALRCVMHLLQALRQAMLARLICTETL